MAASSTCFSCNPATNPNLSSPSMSSAGSGGGPNHRSSSKSRSSFTKSPFLKGNVGSMHCSFSSALILRFPPNFVRQLSTKARRNCSNIGVAQIVAASWANSPAANENPLFSAAAAASAIDGAAVVMPAAEKDSGAVSGGDCNGDVVDGVQSQISSADEKTGGLDDVFRSDASLLVHAGERYGRRIKTDTITTPIVNTSAYWFKNCNELIDFKEGRHTSFEYGRYGNPTTEVLEKKMSALERAETTLFVSSGMYASCAVLSALVPAGGHIVTTTDCYRRTRMFIENELPMKGIAATVIDPADMDSLERALNQNKVTLFFTESPTNPFLRCIDIKLVSAQTKQQKKERKSFIFSGDFLCVSSLVYRCLLKGWILMPFNGYVSNEWITFGGSVTAAEGSGSRHRRNLGEEVSSWSLHHEQCPSRSHLIWGQTWTCHPIPKRRSTEGTQSILHLKMTS